MGDYTLNGIHYKSFGEWEQAYFKNKKKKKVSDMQTEMITQTKKFKLEFEKFKDWVYIKCSDRKDPYLLPRKYFDEMEVKRSKNRKGPYYWLLQIKWPDMYFALSQDYLNQYFETGHWGPDYNTWRVNPLPLLKAGIKGRYYQADVASNGYLRADNKYIRRPFPFELRGYFLKKEVVKKLQKNPKVLKAEIEPYNCYCCESFCSCDNYIISVIYMPSVVEFNRLTANKGNMSPSSIKCDIERRLGIKTFKKREEDS